MLPALGFDNRPPPLPRLLGEARSIAAWPIRMLRSPTMPARVDGPSVLVIPGFLASDRSTSVLRCALAEAGFRTHGWQMGFNWGTRADTLARLEARLDRIVAKSGAPVTLLGWSLGGLFARELAKLAPDRVARVVTLGTPFSGDLRANHAWRLYELVNRHKVDAPPIEVRVHEKPPVPTLAFWSQRDGIVSAASARGQSDEADHAFELDCTHIGFATDRAAIAEMIRMLADDDMA